jgi:hypothetical protein
MRCIKLLLTFAMLFSIGQTLATSEQVAAGLGQHLAAVSAADYVKFQKAGYAASLFYIVALACAKLAALAQLFTLTPLAGHRKPIIVVMGLVIVWAVCALITIAFQCDLPHVWAYETGKCVKQVSRDTPLILKLQWKYRLGRADDVIYFVRFSNFTTSLNQGALIKFPDPPLGRNRRHGHLH